LFSWLIFFLVEITPSNEDLTKKKKIKPPSTIVSKQTSKLVSIKSFSFRFILFYFRSSLPTTQIVQLENPADFIPTIIPEQRMISSPRITHIENNNTIDNRRISSPIQTKEQRPKSSNKRQNSEPTQIPVIIR